MNDNIPVMKPQPSREEALFQLALSKPAAKRAAWLDTECEGDPALRARLDALLAAHDAEAALPGEADIPPARKAATIKLEFADEPPDEAVGQTLGRYKLLERIGEGGCGVVYVAEQTVPVRRRVALKVIKLGMDTKQVVARFEAERQALAMMDHPNIAKVLDAGTTDAGRPYFVMELVRGIRITDYCDQASCTTKERLDLFIKVCQAIQHAHQKGIIHRDIKPSNILVTMHDGVPVPKVIDFGIAKATEGRLTDNTVYTQLHQFIGTPAYMSPEQAEMSGLDIDTRSDIYSLGVLLYELLAGSTPFDAKELMASGIDAMRKTIREKEPQRPSTRLARLGADQLTTTAKRRSADTSKLLHQLKGDLDWIVMKCLEKDRQRRYETANGLAADLKRHLDNEPVVARPPSTAYRFEKAIRRNKIGFIAVTGVVAALALGLALAASGWRQARIERDAALQAKADALAAQRETEKSQRAEQLQRQRAETGEAKASRLLYAANMNLAQQAWDQAAVGRVAELLEECKDSPLHDFEWYYWQRQIHQDLRTFRGHLSELWAVAFSPDGQRILTGSGDNTAKVWNVATGQELFTLTSHSDAIKSAAFSPDGLRIVTASADNTAKLWDAINGKELLTLQGHTGPVNSATFSLDGQRVATGSSDKTAKVWDAMSGKELLTFHGHAGPVHSGTFSPDGSRIVSGSTDLTARVWDASTGKELLILTGHSDNVVGAIFSPDGRRIITGSDDHTARVWDAASGKEVLTLKGHDGGVWAVAFSRDGQRMLTGSVDNTAKLWDAASGKEILTLKGHASPVQSVAFSPDDLLILTGSADKTAKLWRAISANDPDTFVGHEATVNSAVFSPDGRRIVTGSDDRTARVWDAVSGKELLRLKGHNDVVNSVAFSPDGKTILTGSDDHTAKLWEVVTGKELLTLGGHSNTVMAVAFFPDGQRIITGSEDQTAKVWESSTGKELFTLKGHRGFVNSVAISPDGKRILTGSDDQTAKVWELSTGKELLTIRGHSGAVWSVAFSPDGRRILTGNYENTATVWEAATVQELLVLKGHGNAVGSVAFSPDGRRIVTASSDRTAKLWESSTGKELLTFKGYSGAVGSVAFSRDGERIITGSQDQTAKVWKMATHEQAAAWEAEEQAEDQRLARLRAVADKEISGGKKP